MPRNACGPAALAHGLVELGLAQPSPDLARRVYEAAPPDTPFALLGTTPWGLAARARQLGMTATRTSRASRAQLSAACAAGVALVCVDLRPLGARWPSPHWARVRRADDEGVELDLLVDVGARRRRYPWATFERAWRLAWVPHPAYWRALLRLDTPTARSGTSESAIPAAVDRPA